jgi:hypothetical protein
LKVFDNETINFSDESKSDENIKRFANGTIILKKIKFPKISEGENIFVELKQQSNGDAYDRTGTVFFVPQDKSQSFSTDWKKEQKHFLFMKTETENNITELQQRKITILRLK